MIDIKTQHPIDYKDVQYYSWVAAVVEYSDPKADLMIRENETQMIVHVTPDNMDYRQSIIDNLLSFHKNIGHKIEFSKSLAISKKVSYFIDKFNKTETNYLLSL